MESRSLTEAPPLRAMALRLIVSPGAIPATSMLVRERRTLEVALARATATLVFHVEPVRKKERTLSGWGDQGMPAPVNW